MKDKKKKIIKLSFKDRGSYISLTLPYNEAEEFFVFLMDAEYPYEKHKKTADKIKEFLDEYLNS